MKQHHLMNICERPKTNWAIPHATVHMTYVHCPT
jgi:hypothetical protein